MSSNPPDPSADARLEGVLESVSDGFYAVDRQWRYILFNRSAEEYFGVSRDKILGRELWKLFPQGRGTEYERLMRLAMDEGVTSRMVAASAMRPDRTVELRIAPLGSEGVAVSLSDVTERTRAEQALRESQQRLDLAVAAHRIGIFDWYVQTGRVVWSPEEEAIFGLAPGTFEGDISGWSKRLLPEDAERMEAEMSRAMAERREEMTFEFSIRRADGEVRCVEGAARFLYAPDGTPERMVGTNMDVTARKQGEAHQRLLINELNHRVKNTLAIVQSIARQTFRGTGPAAATAREAFEGRLLALSAAHNVLTERNWEAASIRELIQGSTAPHVTEEGRVRLSGPDFRLPPKTAVSLALAVHELATNAVKHGALSAPEGSVEVRWTVTQGRLSLTWRERGGPRVSPPQRRGFGSRMLEHGLAGELAGEVRLGFRPSGLVCTVDAPLPADADR